jgi:hypothetical protein
LVTTAELKAGEAATRSTGAVAPMTRSARRLLRGGGTGGNEQLTAWTGVILLVLFAALAEELFSSP